MTRSAAVDRVRREPAAILAHDDVDTPGWPIDYLGSHTPAESREEAARRTDPSEPVEHPVTAAERLTT